MDLLCGLSLPYQVKEALILLCWLDNLVIVEDLHLIKEKVLNVSNQILLGLFNKCESLLDPAFGEQALCKVLSDFLYLSSVNGLTLQHMLTHILIDVLHHPLTAALIKTEARP